MTAACSSKRGIERCRIGVTLRLPITNAKSAQYSLCCRRRYATAQFVSSDSSAKTRNSVLLLALLNYILPILVFATSACCSFQFRSSSSSLCSTDFSQRCAFLVMMLFSSGLMWMMQTVQEDQTLKKLETSSPVWLEFQLLCYYLCTLADYLQLQSTEVEAQTNPFYWILLPLTLSCWLISSHQGFLRSLYWCWQSAFSVQFHRFIEEFAEDPWKHRLLHEECRQSCWKGSYGFNVLVNSLH